MNKGPFFSGDLLIKGLEVSTTLAMYMYDIPCMQDDVLMMVYIESMGKIMDFPFSIASQIFRACYLQHSVLFYSYNGVHFN